MALPKELDYSVIQPTALAATETLWAKYNPLGALPNNVKGNEWINWVVQGDTLMDPYSLYIKFDVSITDTPIYPTNQGSLFQPVFGSTDAITPNTINTVSVDYTGAGQAATVVGDAGMHLIPTYADSSCKQLDSSGQSLISQLQISGTGNTLQNIYEYDVMAKYYQLMGYDPWERIQRRHEGLGGHCADWLSKIVRNTRGNTAVSTSTTNTGATGVTSSASGANLLKGRFFTPKTTNAGVEINTDSNFTHPKLFYQPGQLNNYVDYDVNPNSLGYVNESSATTFNQTRTMGASLQNRNYVVRELLAGDFTMTPQAPYMKNWYGCGEIASVNNVPLSGDTTAFIQNYPKVSGFQMPYSQAFCYSGYETVLSVDTPQNYIKYGYPEQRYRISSDSIYVPLICILGIEWQPEDYKLLPLWCFGRLDINLRLSPYAFFTSHANYSRLYNITRAELNFDAYTFSDDVMNNIRNITNGAGIQMHGTTFKQVIRDEYPGNSLKQYYQISENVSSMKFLMFTWMPKDYESYPNCRKLFFVNPLLTEYFAQIGQKSYPSKTIVGSATNRGTDNIYEMVVNTKKALGKSWYRSTDMIGVANMCLCNRLWSPAISVANENLPLGTNLSPAAAVGTQISTFVIPNCSSLAQAKSHNAGTFGTLGYYYENAVIGAAFFVIDFECFNSEGGYNTGINTKNVGTWVLNLKQKLTDGQTDITDHMQGLPNTTVQMQGWIFIDTNVELRSNGVKISY